jgi:rod shape-determining protein MreD
MLFCLTLLQAYLSGLLSIGNVPPDFLILGVVYIALKEGQMYGTIAGFAVGLLIDLHMGELVGISALAKTLSGFAAGYFFDEQRVSNFAEQYSTLFVVALCTAISAIIQYTIYIRSFDAAMIGNLFVHAIGSVVYTGIFALALVLVAARRPQRIRVS